MGWPPRKNQRVPASSKPFRKNRGSVSLNRDPFPNFLEVSD